MVQAQTLTSDLGIAPQALRNSRRFWLVAAVAIALLCYLTLPWHSFQIYSHDLVAGDNDNALLVSGLENTHTWRDTFAWWYGPWVGKARVSYYRPLTSLVWWGEFQLFGGRLRGGNGFVTVHFLLHFAVCLLLAGFLRRVVGGRLALLGIAFWMYGVSNSLTLSSPRDALYCWKDDPDLWISGAVVVCLWCLLLYWRTARGRYLVGALAAQLVGITFKEMSYVAPILGALLLWHQLPEPASLPLKNRLASVGLLVGVVVLAFILRIWALGGYGYRLGSNHSWFVRWASFCVGGRPAALLAELQLGPLAVASWVFVVWALIKHRFALAGGLGLGSVALWVTDSALSPIPHETLYRLLSLFPWYAALIYHDAALTLTILMLWVFFLKHHNRDQVFAYGWVLLAYLPLLSAPMWGHALYLSSLGWALWLAVAAHLVWEQNRVLVQNWFTTNRLIGEKMRSITR